MRVSAERKIRARLLQSGKFDRLMLEHDDRFFRVCSAKDLLRTLPVGCAVSGLLPVDPSDDLHCPVGDQRRLIVKYVEMAVLHELFHFRRPEGHGNGRDRETAEQRLLHVVVSVHGIDAVLCFDRGKQGTVFVRILKRRIITRKNVARDQHRVGVLSVDQVHHFFHMTVACVDGQMKIADQHYFQVFLFPAGDRHIVVDHDGVLRVRYAVQRQDDAGRQGSAKADALQHAALLF